ncbi:MAG: hypothetical protein U1E29_16320, partial [Coriobacteriia bacterium]|nr:hypothetical protein [Coriobacteriia bacterium]
DVDIAPRLVLADSSGVVLEDRFVSADLFPPGEEASLQMESVPHQVTAIAFFDHAVRGGRDISSSYNFRDIRMLVTVIQSASDGRIAARGLLAPGDSLEFDGLVLSMPEIARIGTFRVTRSLAWPWMTLFGALAVAGLGARVFFPCQQVRVLSDDNGVSVAVRLDLYGRGVGHSRFLHVIGDSTSVASPWDWHDDTGQSDGR